VNYNIVKKLDIFIRLVLQIIKTVARTSSSISKLGVIKYAINKIILNVGLLLFEGTEPV
jgi:hypothetical protein